MAEDGGFDFSDFDDSASTVTTDVAVDVAVGGGASNSTTAPTRSFPTIPSGPPVPNPYEHCLDAPGKKREFTHWGRPTFLRYKILMEYYHKYYDDYIDYMNKRQKGLMREVPRAQEWPERVFRVYTKDGKRLSGNDYKYWFTDKNRKIPHYTIFHAVHSKDYYFRQYKCMLIH